MTRTCATLFSGGGLADLGLIAAGYTPAWAVEYDLAISGVYRANHGDHVIVGDVRGVDFAALPRVDLLWASPPCINASNAKANGAETPLDVELGDAIVRALTTLRPDKIILENVEGYATKTGIDGKKGFLAYRRIRAALDALDYWSDATVIDSADLGVPQNRRRLILRARAGGWMQAHRPWPAPVPWVGWYAAIEDLILTLPDSAFAPWQLARLPEELRESVLAMGLEQTARDATLRGLHEPAATVTANTLRRPATTPRAFIVDGQPSDGGRRVTVRHGDAPMLTVHAQMGARHGTRAYLVNGTSDMGISPDDDPAQTVLATLHSKAARPRALLVEGNTPTVRDPLVAYPDEPRWTVRAAENKGMPRALVPPGRVVALTPRCLARFQAVPDSYVLPDKKSLACKVIGNGVPVTLARVAAETLEDA